MRKALMGLILAATVMTPIAAEAQRGHRGDGDGDSASHSSGRHAEGRAARIEARNEARQARSESAPPQQQQQQQAQPQPQVVQRQRGGDGDGRSNRSWRGNDNNQADNNRGNRGGGGDDGRRGRNTQSIYPQAWQGNPNDPRLRHYQQLERRNQQQGYRRGDNRGNDGRNWRNNRNDGDARRGDRRRGDWNRGWRSDRRYDWNGWRRGNRHRFHLSPYYSPYRDWNYSRFSIGFFLEPLFYNQRYWIGDPWQYRLPPAPYGTQWVRYYNDVLLVDIYTGEVIDTIYDFFW
ncbi:MAG TPA: RcnB family protein [Allosphingosinicella sp.]|jgi:Ni/Co efflux regulator RcnB|nr:RcnB family protein [Allosphingosinicella sp.]